MNDCISICTTSYNRSQYLAQSLPTLAKIMRDDDELIIVDYASTDGIEAVVKKAMGTKKYRLISEPGPFNFGKGMNRSMMESGGNIVFYTHTEILYPEGFLDELRVRTTEGNAFFPEFYWQTKAGSSEANGKAIGLISIHRKDRKKVLWTEEVDGIPLCSDWMMWDGLITAGLVCTRRRVDGLIHIRHTTNQDVKKVRVKPLGWYRER